MSKCHHAPKQAWQGVILFIFLIILNIWIYYTITFCGGRREKFWGISCEKSRFYAKKTYFFPILGGARAGCAPLIILNIWIYYTITFCRFTFCFYILIAKQTNRRKRSVFNETHLQNNYEIMWKKKERRGGSRNKQWVNINPFSFLLWYVICLIYRKCNDC
jgi:hypothetical protein